MNLYVSNLAYSVTDDELRSEFAAFGNVTTARVVMDRETGRSRGFGFVDMPDDSEARLAMSSLEGNNLAGRALKIVEARPKEERPRFSAPSGGPGAAKKKTDRPFGGPRQNTAPAYDDWDDRDRGSKRPKHRERGSKRGEDSGWD